MFKYTNILTGNNITTNAEIKGRNWVKTEEIREFREMAKAEKAEAKAKKEEIKEEVQEPVESKIDIPEDLENLSNADLKEILFELGAEFNSKANKAELIKLVEAHR